MSLEESLGSPVLIRSWTRSGSLNCADRYLSYASASAAATASTSQPANIHFIITEDTAVQSPPFQYLIRATAAAGNGGREYLSIKDNCAESPDTLAVDFYTPSGPNQRWYLEAATAGSGAGGYRVRSVGRANCAKQYLSVPASCSSTLVDLFTTDLADTNSNQMWAIEALRSGGWAVARLRGCWERS